MSVVQRFYTTDQIVRHCSGHTHWFDADSKRFFNSRIGQNAYPTANPFVTLFVSSERCDWGDHYEQKWVTVHVTENNDIVRDLVDVFVGEKRKYSIRSYDSRTYTIDTVGEFQQYNSGKTANRTAKELAKKWEFNMEDMHEYAILENEHLDFEKLYKIGQDRRNKYWEERAKQLA